MPADPVAQEFTDAVPTASKHTSSPAGGEAAPTSPWAFAREQELMRRVEQLERAVLGTVALETRTRALLYCGICEEEEQHASGCLVPALLEKYADGH